MTIENHPFSPICPIRINLQIAAIMLHDKSVLDGRREANQKHSFAMYVEGIQMESDNGLTLYGWEEIVSIEFASR